MRRHFARRTILPLFGIPFLAACGAGAQVSETAATTVQSGSQVTTAAPAAPAAAPAATATPAGAIVFSVVPEQSLATFRVREQLAGFDLPNDAVGTTGAVSGDLALLPDGAVAGAVSRITVDLRELESDSSRRDAFIQQNTLQTARFPLAEFVPTVATGLPSPLPAGGEYAFTITGPMTVHGVEKEVTWQATATRAGDQLTGRATTSVSFSDFGMAAPRVPVVLSVADEIRLELDLVATLAT